MQCPSCQHENPDRAKFCLECAAPFGLRCSSCGTELPATAKFCLECAQPVASAASGPERDPRTYTPTHLADKILQSKSALEGERKQVTVLFADVQGSMDLQENLDPEEWHRIMERFVLLLLDGVHRFEGTVNQFTGDGIMALFGAPIAHEDHAQRACYAALYLQGRLRDYANELRRTKGLNFSVRMGLNSGEVVVGKIGDDLRMDYTAHGHTVGLASRMEKLAEPGRVYMTGNTARLAEGYFELGDLGEFDLKGASQRVRVYELEGTGEHRTRLDVSRARGFSRFVGRADEMAILELALNRTRDGNGQVVGVVGQAGVGKSRLCLEFAERCRANGVPVLEAHCPAHGKTVSLVPILELLRDTFGITARDSDRAAREKIAGKLVLLDPGFDAVLPLLFDFLGVPDAKRPVAKMDPEARQRQLLGFMRRLVQALSEREPTVLLFDDVQWIDPGSAAFLAQLVEATSGTRTVLLVNFRPEYHAEWMGKSEYQQIPLSPLGPEAICALLDELLGDDATVVGLRDLVRERTGGNPFFIEEVVQSLVDSESLSGARGAYRLLTPLEDLTIPATVQAVLGARVDRLPEREKQVLQSAAVAAETGKRFSERLLGKVVGIPGAELLAALSHLQADEFVKEEALYPEREFIFKHPLTQSVVYDTQLAKRRAEIHAAVAHALEEIHADALDEHAARIAHHFEEAGHALTAARWLGRAARRAGVHDLLTSARHWRQARALLSAQDESDEMRALGLEACRGLLNASWREGDWDEMERVFQEGAALAERAGDLRARAILENLCGNVKGNWIDPREGFAHMREAVGLADRAGDPAVQRALTIDLTTAHGWLGEFREGLRLLEELGPDPEDRTLGLDVLGYHSDSARLCWGGWLYVETGRLEEAERSLDRALVLANTDDDPDIISFAHLFHVLRLYRAGDKSGVREHGRRMDELGERTGVIHIAYAHWARGIAQLMHEDWTAAGAELEEFLRLFRERRGRSPLEGMSHSLRAEAALGAGDLAGAIARAKEAVSVARSMGTRGGEVWALVATARILLADPGGDQEEQIKAALTRVAALIKETGSGFGADLHELRAGLARLQGDHPRRKRELREAHRLYTEMGAMGHAERVGRELAAA